MLFRALLQWWTVFDISVQRARQPYSSCMWNSLKVIWRPCRATEYFHKMRLCLFSLFYLQVLGPRCSCEGEESQCRCWQSKALSLLFKSILCHARVKGIYLLGYSFPNPDLKSSPSLNVSRQSAVPVVITMILNEEGCRQWLEMKTVLQFLCGLEGKNSSGPTREFFRSLGKRRRMISQGQTFWKCSLGCGMEQVGIFIWPTAPGPQPPLKGLKKSMVLWISAVVICLFLFIPSTCIM